MWCIGGIMSKNKKWVGLSIDEAYVEEIENENKSLKEKVRLADLLINKIDSKEYKQTIGTYRLLTKDT